MATQKITHVIFDLDGTLIDESSRLDAQASAVAWKFGESLEDKQKVIDAFFAANDTAEAYKENGKSEYKGNIPWYMEEIGKMLGVEVTEEEATMLADAWREAYSDSYENPELFQDAVPCLQDLKDAGYILLLASGSTLESRQELLEEVGIDDYFSEIFAAADVGFQKQDIRFWEELLEQVDIKPEAIVVVGNQINDDIMHPQALSMTTVLVERPDTLKKHLDPDEEITPDHTIEDLELLPNLL